jgi:hypothetical protein
LFRRLRLRGAELALGAKVLGDHVDELGGQAEDLVRGVSAGAQFLEEGLGENLGAFGVEHRCEHGILTGSWSPDSVTSRN